MDNGPSSASASPGEFPPTLVVEFAERLEADGADQLWVIEDCFYTAGVSLAAAALARTDHLTVGIGILPAVARNPAITAMELATLARLAPGRVIAGGAPEAPPRDFHKGFRPNLAEILCGNRL